SVAVRRSSGPPARGEKNGKAAPGCRGFFTRYSHETDSLRALDRRNRDDSCELRHEWRRTPAGLSDDPHVRMGAPLLDRLDCGRANGQYPKSQRLRPEPQRGIRDAPACAAQAVDSTGAVLGQRIAYVPGGVGGFGRAYFIVPGLPIADSYRVSVW